MGKDSRRETMPTFIVKEKRVWSTSLEHWKVPGQENNLVRKTTPKYFFELIVIAELYLLVRTTRGFCLLTSTFHDFNHCLLLSPKTYFIVIFIDSTLLE